MKISGIYKIQSISRPERFYIGSSLNIKKRWNHHINSLRNGVHHSPKLQNHFNKYGEYDLVFKLLLGCDEENILSQEQYFLDSLNPYFNIYKTTRFYSTEKPSEESNIKRSISMTGKKWTLEARERFSKICKGKPKSEEHKRKISEALKGNIPAPKSKEAMIRLSEMRKGEGNPMYGKHSWNCGKKLTPEQIEKLRIANTGRIPWNKGKKGVSEETRQKMRIAATGSKKPRTVEHQKKLSESRKRNNLLRKMEGVS